MTIDQALDYIHGKFRKGSVPGLHRIRHILGKLGNPQEKLNFVHIAGTNGKGSTAAMTASILQKAGYDGYLSIEFEGVEETLYGISVGFENLQRLLAIAEQNP